MPRLKYPSITSVLSQFRRMSRGSGHESLASREMFGDRFAAPLFQDATTVIGFDQRKNRLLFIT
jgi:hypothetical protein